MVNEVRIPVRLDVLKDSVNDLQGILEHLKPDSSSFKHIVKYLQQMNDEITRFQALTNSAFSDQAAFNKAGKSIDKMQESLNKANVAIGDLKFSDIKLDASQLKSFQAVEVQIKAIKEEFAGIKEQAKQSLLSDNATKDLIGNLNPSYLKKDFDALSKAIDSEVSKLETKLINAQNKLNDALNKKQSKADEINRLTTHGISKEGLGEEVFNRFFQQNKAGLLSFNSRDFRKGEAKQEFLNYLAKQFTLTKADIDSIQAAVKSGSAKSFDNLFKNMGKSITGNVFTKRLDANTFGDLNGLRNAVAEAEKAQQELAAVQQKFNDIQGNSGAVGIAAEKYQASLDKLNEELFKLQHNAVNAAQALPQVVKGSKTVNSELTQLQSTLSQANAKFLQIQRTTQNFNQIKMAIVNFMGFRQTLNLVKNAVSGALNHIKELDTVMNKISIVTDMSTSDLWNQVDAYSKMAQTYGVSIKGAYEVSQIYYQQGLKTNDVLTLTNETLKLAKISGLDYAQTTDYMTTALRGFKLEMEDASTIVDVYSNLAAHTAVSSEELAIAMSKTASSMESVGSTFQETSAMIGTMVAVTRETSTNIGTALKSIASRYGEMKKDMSAVIDAEGEAISYNKVDAALQSIGISMKTADGQFREFTDVIIELGEKWDELDSVQQRYIATQFAGNRQQSRFLALVSNVDLLKQNISVAEDSEDTGTLQALKALDSVESKLEQVKVAYQQFYTTVGGETIWKGALDGLRGFIDYLNGLPKLFSKIPIGAIAVISNALGLIKMLAERVIGWVADTWLERINKSAEESGENMGNSVTESVQGQVDNMRNIGKELGRAASEGFAEGAAEGANQATSALINTAINKGGSVGATVAQQQAQQQTPTTSSVNSQIATQEFMKTTVTDWFTGTFSDIDLESGTTAIVASATTAAAEASSTLKPALSSVGLDVGISIAQGILQSMGMTTEAAKELSTIILTTIQNTLDIHSPSPTVIAMLKTGIGGAAVQALAEAGADAGESAEAFGERLMQVLAESIKNGETNIKNLMSVLGDDFDELLKELSPHLTLTLQEATQATENKIPTTNAILEEVEARKADAAAKEQAQAVQEANKATEESQQAAQAVQVTDADRQAFYGYVRKIYKTHTMGPKAPTDATGLTHSPNYWTAVGGYSSKNWEFFDRARMNASPEAQEYIREYLANDRLNAQQNALKSKYDTSVIEEAQKVMAIVGNTNFGREISFFGRTNVANGTRSFTSAIRDSMQDKGDNLIGSGLQSLGLTPDVVEVLEAELKQRQQNAVAIRQQVAEEQQLNATKQEEVSTSITDETTKHEANTEAIRQETEAVQELNTAKQEAAGGGSGNPPFTLDPSLDVVGHLESGRPVAPELGTSLNEIISLNTGDVLGKEEVVQLLNELQNVGVIAEDTKAKLLELYETRPTEEFIDAYSLATTTNGSIADANTPIELASSNYHAVNQLEFNLDNLDSNNLLLAPVKLDTEEAIEQASTAREEIEGQLTFDDIKVEVKPEVKPEAVEEAVDQATPKKPLTVKEAQVNLEAAKQAYANKQDYTYDSESDKYIPNKAENGMAYSPEEYAAKLQELKAAAEEAKVALDEALLADRSTQVANTQALIDKLVEVGAITPEIGAQLTASMDSKSTEELIQFQKELQEQLKQTGNTGAEAGNKVDEGMKKANKNSGQMWSAIGMGITTLSGTLGGLVGQTTELGGAISSLGTIAGGAARIIGGIMSHSPMGWIMGITTAITGIISFFQNFSLEKQIERAEKKFEELNNKAKEIKANFKTLDKGIDKYNELAKKRYESEEAEEEYQTHVDELTSKFPELLLGFDSAGNAIMDTKNMEDVLTAAREESAAATLDAVKAEREKAKLESQKATSDLVGKLDNFTFTEAEVEDTKNWNAASIGLNKNKKYDTSGVDRLLQIGGADDLGGVLENFNDPVVVLSAFQSIASNLWAYGNYDTEDFDGLLKGVNKNSPSDIAWANLLKSRTFIDAYTVENGFSLEKFRDNLEDNIGSLSTEETLMLDYLNELLRTTTNITTAFDESASEVEKAKVNIDATKLDTELADYLTTAISENGLTTDVQVMNHLVDQIKTAAKAQDTAGVNKYYEWLNDFINTLPQSGDIKKAYETELTQLKNEVTPLIRQYNLTQNAEQAATRKEISSTLNSSKYLSTDTRESSAMMGLLTEYLEPGLGDNETVTEYLDKNKDIISQLDNYWISLASKYNDEGENLQEKLTSMLADGEHYSAEDIIRELDLPEDDVIAKIFTTIFGKSNKYDSVIKNISKKYEGKNVGGTNLDDLQTQIENYYDYGKRELTSIDRIFYSIIANRMEDLEKAGQGTESDILLAATNTLRTELDNLDEETRNIILDSLKENGIATKEAIAKIKQKAKSAGVEDNDAIYKALEALEATTSMNIKLSMQALTDDFSSNWSDSSKNLKKLTSGIDFTEMQDILDEAENFGGDFTLTRDDFIQNGDKLVLTAEKASEYWKAFIEYNRAQATEYEKAFISAERIVSNSVVNQVGIGDAQLYSTLKSQQGFDAISTIMGDELENYLVRDKDTGEILNYTNLAKLRERLFKKIEEDSDSIDKYKDYLDWADKQIDKTHQWDTGDYSSLMSDMGANYATRLAELARGAQYKTSELNAPDVKNAVDKIQSAYGSFISDLIEKGADKINLDAYKGIFNTDIEAIKGLLASGSTEEIIRTYAMNAGKTLEEVDGLLSQYVSKTTSKYTGIIEELMSYTGGEVTEVTREALGLDADTQVVSMNAAFVISKAKEFLQTLAGQIGKAGYKLSDYNATAKSILDKTLFNQGGNSKALLDFASDDIGADALENLANSFGLKLDQLVNVETGQVLGNMSSHLNYNAMAGKYEIQGTFSSFISAIEKEFGITIDRTSKQYVESLKAFNDAAITKEHEVDKAVTEELKSIISLKPGESLNIASTFTVLQSQMTEWWQSPVFNNMLKKMGAILTEDGILTIEQSANIKGIIQMIAQKAAEAGALLPEELDELNDALVQALRDITNIISSGIGGSISSEEKRTLTQWAADYGVTDLQFIETAEGYQLATESAKELYYTINAINSLQGQAVFEKLKDNLIESDERFKTVQSQMKYMDELRTKIQKTDKYSPEKIKQYKKELQIAERILAVRSVVEEDDSFNFMSHEIPGGQNNPLNWYSNWQEGYQALNEGRKSGYMDYKQFYNLFTEIGNLASESNPIPIGAGKFLTNMEDAQKLITQAAGTLRVNAATGKLEVSFKELAKLGISFGKAGGEMDESITAGMKEFANAQVNMLDGLIKMLETIAQMEDLKNIGDGDGTLDLSEIFPNIKANPSDFTVNDEVQQLITEYLNPESGKYISWLQDVTLGNETLAQLFDKAKTGTIKTKKEADKFYAVMKAFHDMNVSQDWTGGEDTVAEMARYFNQSGIVNQELVWGDQTIMIGEGEIIPTIVNEKGEQVYQWTDKSGAKLTGDAIAFQTSRKQDALKALQQGAEEDKVTLDKSGKSATIQLLDDKPITVEIDENGKFSYNGQTYDTLNQIFTAYLGEGKKFDSETLTKIEELKIAAGLTVVPTIKENPKLTKDQLEQLRGQAVKDLRDEFANKPIASQAKYGIKLDKETSDEELQAWLDSLDDKVILDANTDPLVKTVNELKLPDKYINIYGIYQGEAQGASIDKSGTAKGTVGSSSKVSRMNQATGNVALAQGTLVGELGPELVVSNGHYFVAGQNGAEFIDLDPDAIVFNHLQTESLLNTGMSSGRGKALTNEKRAAAYAKGNINGGLAKASGSINSAIADLKQIRAEWKALAGLSVKDLAGKGGGGGGGKNDPKAFVKDLEKWYNWLQRIAVLEQKINYEEQLRSKLQSDMIAHGREYAQSQLDTLPYLKEQAAINKSLYESQEAYFEKRRAEMNDASNPFTSLYTFDEHGQLKYKDGALAQLSDLAGRDSLTGKANYTAAEQYEKLVAMGYEKYMEYDSSGNKIDKTQDDWQVTAVQAFWDKVDADQQEMQSLHDSIEEHKTAMLQAQQQANEIMKEIEDNQIAVEDKVLNAIEDTRQREIDELQKERDAIEESSENLIDGLSTQLQKERDMYSRQEENNELEKLQRRLGILQRSGGSSSQIADLQHQITDQMQDKYFEEQEKQIDTLQKASDDQLKRLDQQIDLMTEQLEYEKEHGLLWNQVYEVMSGTPEQITDFITSHDSQYWGESPTKLTQDTREILFQAGQFVQFREKVEGGLDALIAENSDAAVAEESKKITEEAEKKSSESTTANESNTPITPTTNSGDTNTSGKNSNKKKGGSKGYKVNVDKKDYFFDTQEEATQFRNNAIASYGSAAGNGYSTITDAKKRNELINKSITDKVSDISQKKIVYIINNTEYETKAAAEAVKKQKIKDMTALEKQRKNNKEAASQINAATNALNYWKNAEITTKEVWYDRGGMVDETGEAVLHAKEGVLTAAQTSVLRNDILGNKPNSILNLLMDFRDAYKRISSASAYDSIGTSTSGIVIENATVEMNVSKIANDYDAQRAGEQALDKILAIARKSSASNRVLH